MFSFQRAGGGGSPVRERLWNGLVRGILNISRDARSSAVKRIGYRMISILYLKEEANLFASNGGGTTVPKSSSICASLIMRI